MYIIKKYSAQLHIMLKLHITCRIHFVPVGYVGDSIVNYPGTIFVSRITLQIDTFPSQKARKCISESLISKHF